MSAGTASRSALRGSSLLLVGRMLAIGANLAVQVIVVRSLSQEAFGAFAYGIAAANIATVLVSLGMEQTMSRFAALYDETRQPHRLAGALVCYLAVVGTLGGLLVLVALTDPAGVLGLMTDDARTVQLLGVLLLLGPLQALDTLGTTLFAVYGRPQAIFLRRYVLTPALRIGAVLLVVLGGHGVHALAAAYVAVTALGLAVYLPPLLRLLRRRGVIGSGHGVALPVRPLARFTAAAVTADLLAIALFASDALIVGALAGPADVALLQSVQPLAAGCLVIFYATIPLFIPTASRLFSGGDAAGAEQLYTTASLWVAVFTFPVAALTVACAPATVQTFFGAQYAEAAPVLALLAAGQYSLAVFGLSTLLLKAHGSLRLLATANVAVTVLNCGGNVLLVQRFGPVGVAAGTAGCTMLLAGAKAWILRHELGIRPFRPMFARSLAVVLVAGLGVAAVARLPGMSFWADVLLVLVVWLAVLRMLRRELDVPAVFPEAAALPVLRRVVTPA